MTTTRPIDEAAFDEITRGHSDVSRALWRNTIQAYEQARIASIPHGRVERVAKAIQHEAQTTSNDSPVDYGDAEALARVALAALEPEPLVEVDDKEVVTIVSDAIYAVPNEGWQIVKALRAAGYRIVKGGAS